LGAGTRSRSTSHCSSVTSVGYEARLINAYYAAFFHSNKLFDGVEDVAMSRGTSLADFGVYTYSMDDLLTTTSPVADVVRLPATTSRLPAVVSVGDVDGDGCSDLISASSESGVLIFGSPDRRFSTVTLPRGQFFALEQQIGDVTGDGFADLVVNHRRGGGDVLVEIVAGARDRSAIGVARVPIEVATLSSPVVLPVGADLDLDGSNEFGVRAAGTYEGQAWFRWRTATGTLERVRPIGHTGVRGVVGDVNGDGYLDFRGETVRNIYLGEASGPQDAPVVLGVASGRVLGGYAAVGDVNDDGIDDLIAKTAPNTLDSDLGVAVFLGNSSVAALSVVDSEYRLSGVPYSGTQPGTQSVFLVKRAPRSGVRYLVSVRVEPRYAAVLSRVRVVPPGADSVAIDSSLPLLAAELISERFAYLWPSPSRGDWWRLFRGQCAAPRAWCEVQS
jgi:hypothetical protein